MVVRVPGRARLGCTHGKRQYGLPGYAAVQRRGLSTVTECRRRLPLERDQPVRCLSVARPIPDEMAPTNLRRSSLTHCYSCVIYYGDAIHNR